jgi:hypothetical protein
VNWREREVCVRVGKQIMKLPGISNDESCERVSVKARPGRTRVQCVQHEN